MSKNTQHRGRPASERAEWVPSTFQRFYRAHGLTIEQIAEQIPSVSVHTIRRWQSERSGVHPTPDQRSAVAKTLSKIIGKRVQGAWFARRIEAVTFKFKKVGA